MIAHSNVLREMFASGRRLYIVRLIFLGRKH